MKKLADKFFNDLQNEVYLSTDKLLAPLFLLQWIAGIIFASFITPLTWIGSHSQIHIHLYAAIFLGALTNLVPMFFCMKFPGKTFTRYVVALGQSLTSALLIHLTGGRIETHFHVFGSLAFLAFYRDYKVLLIATAVTAIDHFTRGIYFPESVFGIITVEKYRWIEHAAWVVFEDIFLFLGIKKSLQETRTSAIQKAELSIQNKEFSSELDKKSRETDEFTYALTHDLTSSLRGIGTLAQWISLDNREQLDEDGKTNIDLLLKRVNRLSGFIQSILDYSKVSAEQHELEVFNAGSIFELVKNKLSERYDLDKVQFILLKTLPILNYPKKHFFQILECLIENSIKYAKQEKLIISIDHEIFNNVLEFSIADNGIGIDEVHHERIFKVFQILESREKSDDVGIGLPMVKKIVEEHGGAVEIKSALNQGVKITFTIPLDLSSYQIDKNAEGLAHG